jgi:hypothetical protein
MKSLTVLALSLLLTACGLTPRQKAVLVGIGATSLALSLKKSDSDSDRHVSLPGNPCASPQACQ